MKPTKPQEQVVEEGRCEICGEYILGSSWEDQDLGHQSEYYCPNNC